jgi:hypothetical protein
MDLARCFTLTATDLNNIHYPRSPDASGPFFKNEKLKLNTEA